MIIIIIVIIIIIIVIIIHVHSVDRVDIEAQFVIKLGSSLGSGWLQQVIMTARVWPILFVVKILGTRKNN